MPRTPRELAISARLDRRCSPRWRQTSFVHGIDRPAGPEVCADWMCKRRCQRLLLDFCPIQREAKPTTAATPAEGSARHGGRREGAGRKPSRFRVGVPHRRREPHLARHPVHVTMRAREGLPSFRGDRLLFEAIERSIGSSEKPGFRVVHFSVQSNHLHLIVEAEDEGALSRGMQGLTIRMALAVHRALGHGGTIFSDRYHAHQLRTPRETRAALLYVLQNWAKHGRGGDYDCASSAFWFDGWTKPPRPATGPPLVAAAQTWLVRVGWKRHGLLRPGERPDGRARRPLMRPAWSWPA